MRAMNATAGALLGLTSLFFGSDAAVSQSPARSPYPLNDTPVTLASGTVVRVRNIVVFDGPSGKSLTLYIQSPAPATDSARLAGDARDLLDLHGASSGVGPLTGAI